MAIIILTITVGLISFVLGFYYKTKYVYIITRHMGLTSELIGIYFDKKSAYKISKKIKTLNRFYNIYVTKYRTFVHLSNQRKCNKNFVEGVYEI